MKNKEIFSLRETLNEVEHINGKVFAYAIFKNKAILDAEIEAINSVRVEPGEEFAEYDKQRIELCESHSEKDENGKIIFDYKPNGQQAFKIIDHEKFGVDYEKLVTKYKDLIDEVNLHANEFAEFLEKDTDIILRKISIADLPDEISASFLEKIKYILD